MKKVLFVFVAAMMATTVSVQAQQPCSYNPTLPPPDTWQCGSSGMPQPFCPSTADGDPRSIQVFMTNLDRQNSDPVQSGDRILVTRIADRMPQGIQDTVWMRSCLPSGVTFDRFHIEPCVGQPVPPDSGGRAYIASTTGAVMTRVWGRYKCSDPMITSYEVIVAGTTGDVLQWSETLIRTNDVSYAYVLVQRVRIEIGQPLTP